jgi:hypothetical protein
MNRSATTIRERSPSRERYINKDVSSYQKINALLFPKRDNRFTDEKWESLKRKWDVNKSSYKPFYFYNIEALIVYTDILYTYMTYRYYYIIFSMSIIILGMFTYICGKHLEIDYLIKCSFSVMFFGISFLLLLLKLNKYNKVKLYKHRMKKIRKAVKI